MAAKMYTDSRGYRMFGKVYEHRLIMEQHLGRPLSSDEVVHHKDGNPSNNDLSNLEVLNRVTHRKAHAKEKGQCLECEGVEWVKGLCFHCYYKKANTKDRRKRGIPVRLLRGICVVEDCNEYVNARGLCNNHYRQSAKRGEMEGRAICKIVDCFTVVSGRGLCNRHYKKKQYQEKKEESYAVGQA